MAPDGTKPTWDLVNKNKGAAGDKYKTNTHVIQKEK
jgi:hypothetical protein